MKTIELASTLSTNSWLADHTSRMDGQVLVYALNQTAGRGQRGNSWESEPGKNLTASILLYPEEIEPSRQFMISEAVALAVTDLLSDEGVEARIKWPNDIYVEDRKICGILIEHAILPKRILHTIAGIGINVNQERFLSDAPNPVSLTQITGLSYSIPRLASILGEKIEIRMRQVDNRDSSLHDEFMAKMWRNDGSYHPFRDRNANEEIEAMIMSVASDGLLTLKLTDGATRSYAFKEIEFIL